MKDEPRAAPSPDEQTALLDTVLGALADVAVIATDTAFRIHHINPVACTLFGYRAQAVIGRTVTDIHDEIGVDNRRFHQAIQRAVEAGDYAFPQRVTLPDGTQHQIESRLLPLRIANGELHGYALLARDVTERVQAESRERKLLRAVEQSPVAIIITNTRGIVEYINARFTQVTGYNAAESIGQRMGFLKSGLTPAAIYADLWQTILAGREWAGELQNRRKNGELYWDAVRIMPISDSQGVLTHFVSLQEDITVRKASEDTLRLWATVFENSGEAVMITSANNRILSVNRAFSEITGYPPEEAVGQSPAMLNSGHHSAAFFAGMWQTLNDAGHWQGEIWDRRKNGEIYPKWLGITAVKDDKGELAHYVAIFSDISERKAAQARIEFLAHHDPLTGLPNRLLLRDRLERALAQADRSRSRVALLFLDLDRFKTINDSLGHPVGDQLLQAVTARLASCIRDTDTISRQGGDEFVVLLPSVRDADAVADVAQSILEKARDPFDLDGQTLTTSFSIGISLYPDDGLDFDTLLKKADTAMYHAKDAGRNAYRFFTEQMNINSLERLLIHNRMRRAVEQSEFVLYYQPQIDLGSGLVIGVEALLRWNNPELGMVPPDRFIPIAEEGGHIVAIGEWVLHEACRQAQAWRAAGLPPLSMAVNISALQIQRPDFAAMVKNALNETGFNPEQLELELTESVLIQNVEHMLDMVHTLKAIGVRLSIDDFGTGYSSLSYLKRFDVDRIKIDRSFIRDLTTDPEDAAIVRAIIQMAQSLHLKVLAEGAETSEQIEILRSEGCEEVQGYFYARPMPAAQLFKLIGPGGRLPVGDFTPDGSYSI